MSNDGYIKLMRRGVRELLYSDPKAFLLLTQVADRALRTKQYNVHRLEVGEAMIGDHKKLAMTRKEYRTRLERLVTAGFLTTRGANKGTVAKLSDARVFDINVDDKGHQGAIKRASGGSATVPKKATKRAIKESALIHTGTNGSDRSQAEKGHQKGHQGAIKRKKRAIKRATKEEASKNGRMKEREEPLTRKEAAALYEDDERFAHKDVYGSLSKKFNGGKLQFPSVIEAWLTNERNPRRRPRRTPAVNGHAVIEQPIPEGDQAEMAKELAELRRKAGV